MVIVHNLHLKMVLVLMGQVVMVVVEVDRVAPQRFRVAVAVVEVGFLAGMGGLEMTDKMRAVLFVSPYPICPPIHGGGVFMYQTSMELAKLCDLHLIALLDY